MITNERQYKISKSFLGKLENAVASFDMEEATNKSGSHVFAQAELDALRSEVEQISTQIEEYELLKSGLVTTFKAESLLDLPTILIRARISKGLSQKDLADRLGLKEQQIQRYEAELYSTANLKRLSEIAEALNINIAETGEFEEKPQKTTSAESSPLDWKKFPIKEMYMRSWFPQFSGSLSSALASAESLVESYIQQSTKRSISALLKQRIRTGSTINPYALLAWQCRVLTLAQSIPLKTHYKPSLINDSWIKKLVKLSEKENGPILAKSYLEDSGIALVIEPHLSSTHLDGAAMLGEDRPIIGLTLRYDRLDNFWFVLLHEIGHIAKHLKKGTLEDIFDDLEASPDALEREADLFASESLIPSLIWSESMARYVRSEKSVNELAKELQITPAIVAGRIRLEAENYVILNNLVGQGKVRKHFPNVNFGL